MSESVVVPVEPVDASLRAMSEAIMLHGDRVMGLRLAYKAAISAAPTPEPATCQYCGAHPITYRVFCDNCGIGGTATPTQSGVERLEREIVEARHDAEVRGRAFLNWKQRAEAAEAKLEGLQKLQRYSWSVSGMVTAYFDPRYVRADELEALLK